MITAIAIDDEPLALHVIENLVSDYDNLELKRTFTNPNEALIFLEEHKVDVIFLDINMPSINGMELAKRVDAEFMIVFTTAYDYYALESYDLNAIDYLMKPINQKRFKQTIDKIEKLVYLKKENRIQNQLITIRADLSTIKLNIDDILYIEGMADYLKIFVPHRKPIITRMTMKNIVELLPSTKFIRIHRSFIVQIDKIIAVKSKMVVLDETKLPIGNTYQKRVSEQLK